MSKRERMLYWLAEVLAGGEGVKIVKCLMEYGDMRDDEIALKLGLKSNIVRKILYRFADSSIVTVQRFRDKDTGWFHFRWRVQLDRVEPYLENQRRRILRRLMERLNYEENHEFYVCPKGCERVTFEEAMEKKFMCTVCGSLLTHEDNSQLVEALKHKIRQLKE